MSKLDASPPPPCHPASRWVEIAPQDGAAMDPSEARFMECEACRSSLDAYRATLPVKPGDRVACGDAGVVVGTSAYKDGLGGWERPIAFVRIDRTAVTRTVDVRSLLKT